jgi:hypothetical protein
MNLQEFVRDVLVQLDGAIDAARETTKRDIKFIKGGNGRTVEFDIAVAVEESDEQKGKAGIKVLQFLEGGGELSQASKSSTVSRIVFGLEIESLTKEEDAAWHSEHQAQVFKANRRLNG